ncbi:hypothetical protein ACVQ8P_06640 [Dellaglioa sp. BT-FLS60]
MNNNEKQVISKKQKWLFGLSLVCLLVAVGIWGYSRTLKTINVDAAKTVLKQKKMVNKELVKKSEKLTGAATVKGSTKSVEADTKIIANKTKALTSADHSQMTSAIKTFAKLYANKVTTSKTVLANYKTDKKLSESEIKDLITVYNLNRENEKLNIKKGATKSDVKEQLKTY